MRQIAAAWQRRPMPEEPLIDFGYSKLGGDWLPMPVFWPAVTDEHAKFVYVLRQKFFSSYDAYAYAERFAERWNRIKGHDTPDD